MSENVADEIRAAALVLDNAQLAVADIKDADSIYAQYMKAVDVLLKHGKLTSLVPLLPLLLRLKGQPYGLGQHFPMEPLFSLRPPRSLVFKTGRQVSKSTGLAAQGCVQAATIPYFSSLYVAPRYDQTRRFSNNYVRPFLSESPLGHALLNSAAEQSVLQRTFKNGAAMHFSFAFLDAERIRGYSADQCRFDEVQDIDPDFLPVITEVLSASKYDLRQYTGTPKTLDNVLSELWDRSSQAEWIIPCMACNRLNVSTTDQDLHKMIHETGLVCAHCGKLLDAGLGHWEHRYPEKRGLFTGYHVPQVILPMHYSQPHKWASIIEARDEWSKAKYLNEKLGEACDVRVNLISKSDIIAASSLPFDNDIKATTPLLNNYLCRTMGVDWGGGGIKGESYTTMAIMGHKPDGGSDLLFGMRFANATDASDEAVMVLKYFRMFGCHLLAHDFGGAGAIRETLLIQFGFPIKQLFPAAYVCATSADMVTYKAPVGTSTRAYYSVDKARSLVLMCQLIRHKVLKFPRFETWKSLANDILSLVEDKRSLASGSDVYLITKKATQTDDFAHSINLATLCYWHSIQRYPDLARQVGIRITKDQEAELNRRDYDDEPEEQRESPGD